MIALRFAAAVLVAALLLAQTRLVSAPISTVSSAPAALGASKPGDWWVLAFGHESGPRTVEWRIDRVEGDRVFLTAREVRHVRAGMKDNQPPPDVQQKTASLSAPLLELYDLWPPANAASADTPCGPLGKNLTCHQLTWSAGRGEKYTVLLSPEVKGGLVQFWISAGLGSSSCTLVGYGSGLDPSNADPYAAPGFKLEAGVTAPDYANHN